ncbi:MAG: hypothetical protein AB7O66_05325, partial [Limisphaerales bacterium]
SAANLLDVLLPALEGFVEAQLSPGRATRTFEEESPCEHCSGTGSVYRLSERINADGVVERPSELQECLHCWGTGKRR